MRMNSSRLTKNQNLLYQNIQKKNYMLWKLSWQEEMLRQSNSLGQRGESELAWIDGVDEGLANLWRQKMSASAALCWTSCCHGEEDSTQRDCITMKCAFPALVNPAVTATFPSTQNSLDKPPQAAGTYQKWTVSDYYNDNDAWGTYCCIKQASSSSSCFLLLLFTDANALCCLLSLCICFENYIKC